MKGGKQPEDLFSHFDFNFRLQPSCWREGAVSGLPYVVLLLSHCFARTYVGIWYICICRYICIHIYVSVASSAQSVCFAHSNCGTNYESPLRDRPTDRGEGGGSGGTDRPPDRGEGGWRGDRPTDRPTEHLTDRPTYRPPQNHGKPPSRLGPKTVKQI